MLTFRWIVYKVEKRMNNVISNAAASCYAIFFISPLEFQEIVSRPFSLGNLGVVGLG